MAYLNTVELQIKSGVEYVSIDIDQDTSFAINLQLTDIMQPTATKIPYSTQISLPATKKNNDLFNHIWKPDSRNNNFDPLIRTDFRLYINNNLYQTGYIKLEEYTDNSFKIRLYGGLGEYFYTLADDEKMRLKDLRFGDMFDHIINAEFVYKCWNQGETYYNASDKPMPMNDYFCYAMTYQGEYDNFDNGRAGGSGNYDEVKWSSGSLEYSTDGDLIEHDRSFHVNDVQYDGEYRAYYQKPMVKLSTIFNKIIETIDKKGWTTTLDNTFFNDNNPYWADLWMICPQYNISADAAPDYLKLPDTGTRLTSTIDDANATATSEKIQTDISVEEGESASLYASIPLRFRIAPESGSNDEIYQRGKLYVGVQFVMVQNNLEYPYHLSCDDYDGNKELILYHNARLGTTERVKRKKEIYYKKPNHDYDENGAGCKYTFSATIPLPEKGVNGPNPITGYFKVTMYGNTHLRTPKDSRVRCPTYVELADGAIARLGKPEGIRSNTKITYAEIIDSNVTCYDFLMSYCKIFGMYFVKNPIENEVAIMTRNSFYANQERLNWTHRLDYNKQINITPLGWDYKIGVFKWKDLGTKYEEDYKNRINREYGSMRFNTRYPFSDEEKNYLEGNIFNNCIITSDYSKYYKNRTGRGSFMDAKSLPYLQNSDRSKVDINFILVFRNGYHTDLSPKIAITDDDNTMTDEGFCWNTNPAHIIASASYPKIVRSYKASQSENSLNFGRPFTAYNKDEERGEQPENGDETLYAKFWRNYLKDRFSEETKIMTAWFVLNLTDISQNLFNKFIYINDSLWLINKIYNFDPLKKQSTKVELVSVQDVTSYLSQRYIEGQMTLSRDGTILYNSMEDTPTVIIREEAGTTKIQLTLECNIDWNIELEEDNISVTIPSGSRGTYPITINIPVNETGSALTHSIPIKWGSTITILQIIQISNWKVTATSNVGTATANGETGEIEVANGEFVNFNTPDRTGYGFGYWIINNQYYYSQSVTLIIESDTEAKAWWYNLNTTAKMSCNDDNTSVNGVAKTGPYWFLTVRQDYTFVNRQTNLAGYLFESDTKYTSPATSVSRTITTSDNNTLLTVFYDTLLANIQVTNNTGTAFDAATIILTSPTGPTITSPTGTAPAGSVTHLKYAYPTTDYGTYSVSVNQPAEGYISITPSSINYQRKSTIPTLNVTVSNLKWKNDQLSVIANGGTLTNQLDIPAGLSFTIESDTEGVTPSPASGTGGRSISVTIPANTAERRTITMTAHIADGATFSRQLRFTIEQDSGLAPAELSIAPNSTTLSKAVSVFYFNVTSNTTWEVSINEIYSSWLTLSGNTFGEGNGRVELTTTGNSTGAIRTANVEITTTRGENDVSVTHIVTQNPD